MKLVCIVDESCKDLPYFPARLFIISEKRDKIRFPLLKEIEIFFQLNERSVNAPLFNAYKDEGELTKNTNVLNLVHTPNGSNYMSFFLTQSSRDKLLTEFKLKFELVQVKKEHTVYSLVLRPIS